MKVSKEIYITIGTDDQKEEEQNKDSDIFYNNKITLNRLVKIAENNNIEIAKAIYLNEPHRFKNKELKHLEQNIYANIYKKYEGKNENIKLFLVANPYSEVEHVANKIIENVRENRL